MSKARAHIFVEGFVQGVFFRHNTLLIAKKIGISGFVKNLPDGRVEAVFEGEKNKVEKMIEWIKEGPEHAKVKKHDIKWGDYTGEFDNFEIR